LTKILSTCNYTSNIRKFFKTYFISKFISYSQAVDCLFKNWENLNSGAERRIHSFVMSYIHSIDKGLFTRESDFALGYPISQNTKIIIFWRTDQLTAKSRSEIGRVNKPTYILDFYGQYIGLWCMHILILLFRKIG
jgi:hypothetical protein